MTGALLLTAAVMGLAATPHCASMCAAACAWRGHRSGGAQAALLLGRIVGYAAAGALVAGLFQAAGWMAGVVSGFRPIWGIAQLLLLALGAVLLLRGSFPVALMARIDELRGRSPAPPGLLAASGSEGGASRPAVPVFRRFLLGLTWPIVPCGVLHAALLLAALASSAQEGAGVMLIFGIASTPGLVLGTRLWSGFGQVIRRAVRPQPQATEPMDPVPAQAVPLVFLGPAGSRGSAAGRPYQTGPIAAALARGSAVQTLPVAESLSLRLAGAALVASSSWWLWQHYFSPVVSALCA